MLEPIFSSQNAATPLRSLQSSDLFLICPLNHRSHCRKQPDDVDQVSQESDGLNRCEYNVAASSDQGLRPEIYAADGRQIQQSHGRHEQYDVHIVVANDYPIKFLFRRSGCFGLTLVHHTTQVDHEYQPRKNCEHSIERIPREWIG